MAEVHSGEEILAKSSTPWVGRTNIQTTNRWQTDRFTTAKARTSR